MNAIAYVRTHPQALAILSLAAALIANWGLGVLGAVVRREYRAQELPRILRSQLASTEMKVVGSMVFTAVLASFAKGGVVDVHLLQTAVWDALAVASGLYSASLWHEDVAMVIAMVSGSEPPDSKLVTHPPAVAVVPVPFTFGGASGAVPHG